VIVCGALIDVATGIGYPLLVALVMFEAAGLPLPGETALITASIAASRGHLEIFVVIGLAAAAAIVGDNLGYLVARRGGRRLLEADGPFLRHRRRVLEVGEPFFERHGPKAVFFGRWIAGLRVWASWLAGATRMHWPSFLLWNALGGCAWALTVGLLAYWLGHQVENGLFAFGAIGVLAVAGFVASHLWRGRRSAAVD
jgi:membrane protein DedA with SNARE-associated domain